MFKALKLTMIAGLACAMPLLASAHGDGVTEQAQTGGYQIALKLLPAETFTGKHAEMMRKSGAEPMDMSGGAEKPNHHLVVFLKKGGKPVTDADVRIRYHRVGSSASWKSLPVVRMQVAGKGAATTHYGNNVLLKPGEYDVEVTVTHHLDHRFLLKVPG
jgi:hypothetical protein